jgi:hypothetical protein
MTVEQSLLQKEAWLTGSTNIQRRYAFQMVTFSVSQVGHMQRAGIPVATAAENRDSIDLWADMQVSGEDYAEL